MKVSIVIATRNRSQVLKENIIKLLSLGNVHEIIIVDDASDDDTKEIVKELISKTKYSGLEMRYYRNTKRMREAASWNIGSRIASGELVVFLNDDTFVTDLNSIEAIKIRFRQYSNVGIVGFRVVNIDLGPEISLDPPFFINYVGDMLSSISGFVFMDQRKRPRFAKFVTSIMALRKKILERISFDENYRGTSYREESDFQLSVRKVGWRILYEPKAVVVHKDPKIGGCRGYALTERMYWKARNHTYYLRKHFSGFRLAWYILLGMLLLILYRPTHLSRVFTGVYDGLKG